MIFEQEYFLETLIGKFSWTLKHKAMASWSVITMDTDFYQRYFPNITLVRFNTLYQGLSKNIDVKILPLILKSNVKSLKQCLVVKF